MFVWSTEIIFLNLDATILPFKGSNLFVIVAMMSYVNDGILYAKKQIFIYMLATVAVAIVTYLFTKEFSTEVLS
jgi:hypothetical protein